MKHGAKWRSHGNAPKWNTLRDIFEYMVSASGYKLKVTRELTLREIPWVASGRPVPYTCFSEPGVSKKTHIKSMSS